MNLQQLRFLRQIGFVLVLACLVILGILAWQVSTPPRFAIDAV